MYDADADDARAFSRRRPNQLQFDYMLIVIVARDALIRTGIGIPRDARLENYGRAALGDGFVKDVEVARLERVQIPARRRRL